MRNSGATLVVILVSVSLCLAQDTPVAIRGATILTGAGETIESGALVFAEGKIIGVGADGIIPEGAQVIDADGLYVTPGYIDAYSHFGLGSGSIWERESLTVASRRTLDALAERLTVLRANPGDSEWLRAGVTATYVSPGGQNLVGGLGAVIKLNGEVVRESAGVSVSYGETALNAFDAPTTRQGMVAILRQTLIQAQEDSLGGDDGRTYAKVLAKELPFRILTNTPDDILTAMRMAEEFDLDLVLDSATGGHVVAEAIASANIPVVVGPAILGLGDGGPYEIFSHTPSNAAQLHAAGVRVALGTSAFRGRSVAMEALLAKSHGLPEQAALAAITSVAAEVLGMADRLGTLAAGMDADFVVWHGRPLTTWAETRRVFVNGVSVFER